MATQNSGAANKVFIDLGANCGNTISAGCAPAKSDAPKSDANLDATSSPTTAGAVTMRKQEIKRK